MIIALDWDNTFTKDTELTMGSVTAYDIGDILWNE